MSGLIEAQPPQEEWLLQHRLLVNEALADANVLLLAGESLPLAEQIALRHQIMRHWDRRQRRGAIRGKAKGQ